MSLKRPMRRKYIWDEKKMEWVDQRLLPSEVKQDGIIFRPRVYNNLAAYPIYVESKQQLKAILKAGNMIEAG